MKLLFLNPAGRVAGARLGVLADSINDSSSTRKVYLLAGGLALLGILLVVITVWFWRSTKHDPELLAPLEVIGGRRFRRLDGGSQQVALDTARPEAATPMRWGVQRGGASGGPEIDLRASSRTGLAGYDDLHDPALIAVAVAEAAEDGTATPLAAAASSPSSAGSPSSPASGASPAAASAGATDDIDSALAAVGAKVDPPADSSGTSGSADGARAGSVVEDEPASKPPSSGAAATRTGIGQADAGWDGSVELMSTTSRGAAKPVEPLVIVPVDHEVRPSTMMPLAVEPQRRAPAAVARDAEPEDATSVADRPDDEPASIDPLLRMFRNDG
ncbi:MAG: hypothetical protein JWL72_4553 [Ilumatobacteraceae bacterium]|nr:hypothetical protein [Ilumatobacteraceae bacterium]